MILKLFTIRDQKAGIFHPPRPYRSHGEAERDFQRLVNDPKSNIQEFPEDYDLYYLGEYDDNTGKLAGPDTPQHLLKAVSVYKPHSKSLDA